MMGEARLEPIPRLEDAAESMADKLSEIALTPFHNRLTVHPSSLHQADHPTGCSGRTYFSMLLCVCDPPHLDVFKAVDLEFSCLRSQLKHPELEYRYVWSYDTFHVQ